MIQIGPHRLDCPVVLAPMAGVTDRPFRKLCREFGAALTPSEMLSADPNLWDSEKSRLRRIHAGELGPRVVQIAGADPAMLAQAARHNVAHGADIIDINMGCPAKKVLRRAAGSALLRDEMLVADILRQVVAAVPVPVTLKIRTGWCPDQRNGPVIARIAEDAGIQSLAVHGRTRACGFRGEVEYDTIAAIKQSVNIPVFANGDIDTPHKARQVLAHTGADGVMIGRAAQGKPWLFRDMVHFLGHGQLPPPLPTAGIAALVLEHTRQLHAFYGDFKGVLIARKHVGWTLMGLPAGAEARRHFNTLTRPDDQLAYLDRLFKILDRKELAA